MILHVTDLHLDRTFNNPERHEALLRCLLANLNDPLGALATTAALTILFAKSSRAHEGAWTSLVDLLERLTATSAPACPVVIAQTGDVEAFGPDANGHHLGFKELHDTVWPRLEGLGAQCVDLFGNHDIWPHLLLGSAFSSLHAAGPSLLAAEHARLQGPWDEVTVATPGDSPPLAIHRICTVEPSVLLGAFLAQGRICNEPVPSGVPLPLPIAARIHNRLTRTDRVHVALSHHPIHRVPAHRVIRVLRDSAKIRAELGDRALVISGHLHYLHPKLGQTSASHQLVSDSPTVPVRGSTSFVQYMLALRPMAPRTSEDFSTRIRVERLIYTYSIGQGYAEWPLREADIISV